MTATTAPKTDCCPACDGANLEPVYRTESIPVHSCILMNSPQAARAYPRRDLELAVCRDCGLVFNWLFNSSVVAYSPDFEESQHFSETFNTFACDLAKEITAKCGLTADSHVIEIGCGKGEFLAELSRISGCTGIGIDPAFRDDRHVRDQTDRLSFITEWFGPPHFDLRGDVVLCRHTLEHIAPVAEFMRSIRHFADGREGICVVFETPSVHRILEDGAFWDVYYEHVSYFTEASHAWLFRHCGFEVLKSKLVFGGQYIVQYAKPSIVRTADRYEAGSIVEHARLFADRARANKQHWEQTIAEAAASGRPVAIWGGGSKAVAFLSALSLPMDSIRVVDKNPYKQGRYLPGSGIGVLSPDKLAGEAPELVIAMNPIYRDEIDRDLAILGLAPALRAVGD